MSDLASYEVLIASHRKEKKEMQAKIQKLKHAVPKGDKKRKKDVTTEITKLMADLHLKHENELKEFENSSMTLDKDISLNAEDGGFRFNESGDGKSETTDLDKNPEDSQGIQRLSKAQKRRNKKTLMEQERQKAIAEQEIQNLTSLRSLESEKIRKKLCERKLKIHEIQSDGDCLYRAVEHQLSIQKLKPLTAQNLRRLTADYMLSHVDDFMPFLSSETGDTMTLDEYRKYCNNIVTTPVWGGHVEVQVLSQVCGKSIEVIQSDCPSVIAGDEKAEPKLIISYHRHIYGLGEHYNSVIPDTANQENQEG